VPTYVRLVGYVVDGLRYTDEADAIARFFDEASDETDAALPQRAERLLASMPDVCLWILTEAETAPAALTLHVLRSARQSSVALDPGFVRPRSVGQPARGWKRLGPSDIAAAILAESEPHSDALEERENWLDRLCAPPGPERDAAFSAARAIAVSLGRDEQTMARRGALIDPVADALRALSDDEPNRDKLWDIASRLNAGPIRQVSLDALRRGDPTLTDDHIERQRKLLFEVLPAAVAAAARATPEASWLPRARSILLRYDL